MTQLVAEVVPGQPQLVKSYSNARKLFQIGDLPFGVVTYGAGNIGRRSIESFLYDFNDSLAADAAHPPDQLSGQQIATKLLQFIKQPYDAAFSEAPQPQKPVLGFYVAGYSPGSHIATEWEFLLPTDQQPHQPRPDDQFGASWRGIVLPFSRLHFGVDTRLMAMLAQQGVPAETLQKIETASKLLHSQVAFDGMPLQDAIGFCRFILDTTIAYSTYEVGSPTCGGPIHVAIITRGQHFKWISQPEYSIRGG